MGDDRKKVGILTFSYSSNPGSVLQAYALQQTISEWDGCDATIINYQKNSADKPVLFKNVFHLPLKQWRPRIIADWLIRMVAFPWRMKKYEKFFKEYYSGFAERPYSREELSAIQDNYDKFVVGSDQVWNFDSVNVDNTYFLDFVNDDSKKISYAASFGQSKIFKEKRDELIRLIGAFSAISVREESGVDIVSDLIGKKASLVLDPSLIYSENKWNELAVEPKDKDYLLLYLREDSNEVTKWAQDIAAKHNLKVIKVFLHWLCDGNGKKIRPLGPTEWLGYVRNVRFVVTNSFHGICFSLVFKREFFVNMLNGYKTSTNTRMECLLKTFGLEERKIYSVEDALRLGTIDYSSVDKIKTQKALESKEFLKKAIEGELTK